MAAFILAACSDDGNKAGDPDPSAEADFVVESFGDLSICNNKREGATAYVKDEDNAYICTDGDWAIDTNADTRKKSSNGSAGPKIAWDYLNPNIDYGEFVDDRDGQIYKTVKIGDQVWMAENLNYKTKKSWCGGGIGKDAGNCSKYGRLYTWAAAIDSAKFYKEKSIDCGYDKICVLPDTVYGICPSGWHLPSRVEWEHFFTYIGDRSNAAKVLKSQAGWRNGNGTDAYGFSVLPAGGLSNDDFRGEGYLACFWSATESDIFLAYSMLLNYEYDYLGNKHEAYSVRCLQDYSISNSNKDEAKSSSSRCEDCKDDAKSSSSFAGQKTAWDYLNPEIDYGEMVDDRDGQIYKTVKIGDQVWMAENLNYETENSWCDVGHGNNEENCAKYGRLYKWVAAVDKPEEECGYDFTCGLSGMVRGVCPEGWHLPDTTELYKLFAAVGGRLKAGKMLKSQTDWYDEGDGTDVYGFSALPAGCRNNKGYFDSDGFSAFFWSATENDAPSGYVNSAYSMYLNFNYEKASFLIDVKSNAFSVRCIQD